MKRDYLRNLRAKKAAIRYGHPSRNLQLVVISGEGSATTALMLAEVLRETGKKTAVFTTRGSSIESVPYTPTYRSEAAALHSALSAARKQRCETVVVSLDNELEATGVLPTLAIDMVIVTNRESASEELLQQPMRYLVTPSDSNTTTTAVEPHHVITYGDDLAADARVTDVKLYRKGTEVTAVIDHQTTVELATFLIGSANARHTVVAVAAAYVMGAPVEQLADGAARLESVLGNFQYVDIDAPYRVAVDSATSERTVRELIDSARAITRRRLILVCDQSVDPDALSAVHHDVDRLIVIQGHSGPSTDQVQSLSEAVALALRGAKRDDTVLLIGEELAAQVDEEQTRGARLARGGSE